jgi:phage terminase small subunit
LLAAADISLLAAASERWSVYRRAAALMKGSVRGKKYAASERLRLAEQAARKKLVEQDVNLSDFLGMPLERKRGKLRRGQAPEGNEISAEPVFEIDAKLLGEYTVPPQHSIASQALQDYVTLMRELGVGPVTRVRMKTPPEQLDDGSDSDKITDLRSRRQQRAANRD